MLDKNLQLELENLNTSKYYDKNKLYTILNCYAQQVINSIKSHGQTAIANELGISQTKMGIIYHMLKEQTTTSSMLIYIETTQQCYVCIDKDNYDLYEYINKNEITNIYRWNLPKTKALDLYEDLTMYNCILKLRKIDKLPDSLIDAISIIEDSIQKG